MKKILVFIAISLIGNLFAVDTIFQKKTKKISCTVISIASKHVTYYKKESKLTYPIFSIPKSTIRYIKFESGKKIFFTKSTKRIRKPKSIPKIILDSLSVSNAEVDTIKNNNILKDSLAFDTLKLNSTKIDSIEIDAIAKDSLKVDTISVDSIVIDSMFANSEVTDTIEIDSIFVDSFRIETLEIDTIEVDTTEIANSMLDTFKVDSATTSRTVVKRESFKDIFKIKPYIYRKYATFFGFGSTNASFKNSSSNNSSSVSSFNVGINRNFHLNSSLALKLGAFLTLRKGEYEEANTSTSLTFSSEYETVTASSLDLDIPVLISYGIFAEKHKRIRIYADIGPRVSIAISRSYLKELHNYSTSSAVPSSDNELTLFNLGGVISVGAELYNRFIIEAKYDFDITNRYKIKNECTYQTFWILGGYEF